MSRFPQRSPRAEGVDRAIGRYLGELKQADQQESPASGDTGDAAELRRKLDKI